jgi:hypothetical protein
MRISISSDFWFLGLFKNSKERDVKLAEYVDQIAEDAKSVANVWQGAVEAVRSSGAAQSESCSIWSRLVDRPEWTIYSTSIPRSKLETFHDKVSGMLGGNQKIEQEFFICKVGLILQKKQLTEEIIIEELKKMKGAKFFHTTAVDTGKTTMEESIALVQNEVQAITDFAKEYRSKI